MVVQYDGEPNGMKFLNERELLIADYKNGLMVCTIATGVVRPYLDRRNSERFKGINDLVFDSNGNLYFTDQGKPGCTTLQVAFTGYGRVASWTCC